MKFIVEEPFKITTDFWESRPLSIDYSKRTHPHAAWDIKSLGYGQVPYVAPEPGKAYYWFSVRAPGGDHVPVKWPDGKPFAFQYYTYDIYGCVVVLEGQSGHTHVFCHSFINQIFNGRFMKRDAIVYQEQSEKLPFPSMAFHTLNTARIVDKGEVLGYIGDAGYSQAPHVHYELHIGKDYIPYLKRPDPIDLFPDVWEQHKTDLTYDWEKERKRWS